MEKYIKADTVLQFINGCLAHEDKITEIEKAVLTGVKLYVERIPAADVAEVRHGHWEFETYDSMTWCTKAICSSCKQTIANNADLTQDWGKRLFLKDNLFCANCGAKMDEGQYDERTCSTCAEPKYCHYTNKEGKAQYNYKVIIDCLKHGHFFWKKCSEPQKEET